MSIDPKFVELTADVVRTHQLTGIYYIYGLGILLVSNTGNPDKNKNKIFSDFGLRSRVIQKTKIARKCYISLSYSTRRIISVGRFFSGEQGVIPPCRTP